MTLLNGLRWRKINEVATAAEDRDHWRGTLRAANPSYGGRHWTTTSLATIRSKYYFNFILHRTRSVRELFDRPSYIPSDSSAPWRSVLPGPAAGVLSAEAHSTCPWLQSPGSRWSALQRQCSDEHAVNHTRTAVNQTAQMSITDTELSITHAQLSITCTHMHTAVSHLRHILLPVDVSLWDLLVLLTLDVW